MTSLILHAARPIITARAWSYLVRGSSLWVIGLLLIAPLIARADNLPTLDDFDSQALRFAKDSPIAELNREALRHVNHGRELYMSWEFAQSIREYNTALKLKPNMPQALYWHGVALRHLGILDQALAEIDQAMK